MENVVCFLCCRTRGKVVSKDCDGKEMKWSYERVEKVEMAACVVGRARDCVRHSLAKAMLPLEELNLGVTMSFCASGGEVCVGLH